MLVTVSHSIHILSFILIRHHFNANMEKVGGLTHIRAITRNRCINHRISWQLQGNSVQCPCFGFRYLIGMPRRWSTLAWRRWWPSKPHFDSNVLILPEKRAIQSFPASISSLKICLVRLRSNFVSKRTFSCLKGFKTRVQSIFVVPFKRFGLDCKEKLICIENSENGSEKSAETVLRMAAEKVLFTVNSVWVSGRWYAVSRCRGR